MKVICGLLLAFVSFVYFLAHFIYQIYLLLLNEQIFILHSKIFFDFLISLCAKFLGIPIKLTDKLKTKLRAKNGFASFPSNQQSLLFLGVQSMVLCEFSKKLNNVCKERFCAIPFHFKAKYFCLFAVRKLMQNIT